MPPPLLWLHKFELSPEKWVFVPSDYGRESGAEIIEALQKRWKVPHHFAHLQEGGHVAALRQHVYSTWFIRADISNFFGTINRSRVTRILRRYAKRYSDARDMANLSVVKSPVNGDFILPYGFVQSPLIASICLDKSALGVYLRSLLGTTLVKITVYMDDIVISGRADVDGTAIMQKLRERAARSGFKLSPTKTIGPLPEIQVFNLILGYQKLEVANDRLDEFKAHLEQSDSEHVWKGVLGYVGSVNTEQANNLERDARA